jgi:hypothetical protein
VIEKLPLLSLYQVLADWRFQNTRRMAVVLAVVWDVIAAVERRAASRNSMGSRTFVANHAMSTAQ